MEAGMDCNPEGALVSVMDPLLSEKEHDEQQYVSDGSLNCNGLLAIKGETGGMKSSFYILGYYVLAQAALAGAAINLVLYTTRVLHFGNIAAVLIGTNFVGATYLTSFLGGIFADGYVGRYRAAGIFLLVFCLGLVLLTISASVPYLTPPTCSMGVVPCRPASIGQITFLVVSLVLIAVGYGGSEPCAIVFGADQFDEGDAAELIQKSSYFNWQALAYSLGLLIASTFIVYIEDSYGYKIGFAISTFIAMASVCCFFAGTPIYRFQKVQGNPFSHVSRVILAAAYKWKVQLPDDVNLLYEANDDESSRQANQRRKHTKNLRFLDKAATITEEGIAVESEQSPWHLCTVTQVEDVKSLLNLIPASVSTLIYCIVHIQIFTLFVTQGISLDQHFGNFLVPPASLITFNTLTSVLFTAAYEFALMPLIRRFSSTGQGLTTVTRIIVGLGVSVVAMLVASLVERKRLAVVEKYDLFDKLQVPMSIFWQIPQYVLVGLSEVFAYVGLTEFYYVESPDALRGAGACFFLVWVALGSFLSGLSVTFVTWLTSNDGQPGWIANNLNRGHLDYFFLLLAALSAVNVLYTSVCVHTGKELQESFANYQEEDQP
ncbi:hypothetical protein O6H91_04G129200 [Diphasiastrum complanatum]|uniref:Uncharacterized protein n=1 Tax=Diphasiastrum complanatum TaxID=34168 RepID=A0ACC2E215_DIPCM|nr:hypothetical protein O6H91_Y240400 [Diphasiastrum complanatum]KAJ7560425.1 hypothetical protein O6H91_04G129200 [Diphasiastrum complanatum]